MCASADRAQSNKRPPTTKCHSIFSLLCIALFYLHRPKAYLRHGASILRGKGDSIGLSSDRATFKRQLRRAAMRGSFTSDLMAECVNYAISHRPLRPVISTGVRGDIAKGRPPTADRFLPIFLPALRRLLPRHLFPKRKRTSGPHTALQGRYSYTRSNRSPRFTGSRREGSREKSRAPSRHERAVGRRVT